MAFSNHNTFLHKLDNLSSIPLLRVHNSTSYRTKFGGIMTLVSVPIIIVIFAFRIKAREKGELMTFTTKEIYDTSLINLKSSQDDQHRFLRITIIDGSGKKYGRKYFTPTLTYYNEKYQIQIAFSESCMNQTNEGILWDYQQFCLPKFNNIMQLKGKSFNESLSQMFIQIYNCSAVNFNCADQNLIKNKAFLANIHYYNTQFNLDQINYKQRYINSIDFVFIANQASIGNLMYSKYKIKTDRSYLRPLFNSQPIQEQGYYLQEQPDIPNQVLLQKYKSHVSLMVTRSNKTRLINRVDHSIFDILSYIGGLATPIIAIIQLIINMYNQYFYQHLLGQKMYKSQYQKQQNKQPDNIQFQNKNKISAFYDWFKNKICCCCKSNPYAQSYKDQLIRQLNVNNILRKINIFQNVLVRLATTTQLGQQLSGIKKYSIQESKKFRQLFDVFDKEDSNQILNKQIKIQRQYIHENLQEYHNQNIENPRNKQQKRSPQLIFQENNESNKQIIKKGQIDVQNDKNKNDQFQQGMNDKIYDIKLQSDIRLNKNTDQNFKSNENNKMKQIHKLIKRYSLREINLPKQC